MVWYDHPRIMSLDEKGHGSNLRLLKGAATAAGVTCALVVHIGKADMLT